MNSYYSRLAPGVPIIVAGLLVGLLAIHGVLYAMAEGTIVSDSPSPLDLSTPDWDSHPNASYAVRFNNVDLCGCVPIEKDEGGIGGGTIYGRAGVDVFSSNDWFYLTHHGNDFHYGDYYASPILITVHTTGNCTGTPNSEYPNIEFYVSKPAWGTGDLLFEVEMISDTGMPYAMGMHIFKSHFFSAPDPGDSVTLANLNSCYANGGIAEMGVGGSVEVHRRP